MPAFRHAEQDVASFRMFASQMIGNGTVKPKEIVRTFGVPEVTVTRYVKVYRDHGPKGLYEVRPRRSSESVLTEAVREQAQALFDQGQSVPEVAAELKVLANTLHKAIRAKRLRGPQKKRTWRKRANPNHQERAQSNRQRGADGLRRDALAGTGGGGDGSTAIGANRVSSRV